MLAGARIYPDAPTYSHLRCLGEKHGLIYILTNYLESRRLKLEMSILFALYMTPTALDASSESVPSLQRRSSWQ